MPIRSENQIESLQRQFKTSQHLLQLSSYASDKPSLLNEIAKTATLLLDVNHVVIGLANEDMIETTYRWQKGEKLPFNYRFTEGAGIQGWVLLYKTPYLTQDSSIDPQISPHTLQEIASRTLLCVPLAYQGEFYGTLLVGDRNDGKSFDQEDVELASKIGNQAGLTLQHCRLIEEGNRRAAVLETLHQFSDQISEQNNQEQIIYQLLLHSIEIVGGSSGLGGTVEGEKLLPLISIKDGEKRDMIDCGDDGLKLGEWILHNNQAYLSHEVQSDAYLNRSIEESKDAMATLAVPVSQDGACLGWVEVHRPLLKQGKFSWDHVWLVQSLANTAAIALGKSQLFVELQHGQQELRALTAQLVTRLEEERKRIARELHDEAGQELVSIRLSLQLLQAKVNQVQPNQSNLKAEFDNVRKQINAAGKRLSAVSYQLRPPLLDESGLQAALDQLIREMRTRSQLSIDFQSKGYSERLPSEIEINCYRIVQEGLTNIFRYAQASDVQIILLQEEATLSLKIIDDGIGFDPDQIRPKALGLLGIRERVTMLNGDLEIDSKLGEGATLSVSIPLAEVE